MENEPFEDVFPVKNGYIPASYVSLPEANLSLSGARNHVSRLNALHSTVDTSWTQATRSYHLQQGNTSFFLKCLFFWTKKGLISDDTKGQSQSLGNILLIWFLVCHIFPCFLSCYPAMGGKLPRLPRCGLVTAVRDLWRDAQSGREVDIFY